MARARGASLHPENFLGEVCHAAEKGASAGEDDAAGERVADARVIQ